MYDNRYMESIFLTGPKHCGKTSAGQALASLLSERQISCDFIDLDELIKKITGRTPRQLYLEDPALFMRAEAEAMAKLVDNSPSARRCLLRVTSLGGGIIDNEKAVSLLKKSGGTIVYLSVSADTAWQRIAEKGELPPFLRTKNPQKTHRTLHEKRVAEYQKFADIAIDAEGKTPEEIAGEIIKRLMPY
jgi:shikimate kinase